MIMEKKEVFALYFVLFLLAAGTVSAAKISGAVYDLDLDKIQDVIVEINTKPKQQYVAKNSTYLFSVPFGEYVLSAKKYSDGTLVSSAQENLTVKDERGYVLDLILFPSFAEEEEILAETDFDIETGLVSESPHPAVIALVLLAIAAFFLILRMRGNLIIQRRKEIEKEEMEIELDKVIDFIKKEGGRTTQKQIRKYFPQSEAKISLILTELEDKGTIKKIKKGRGNIIILN